MTLPNLESDLLPTPTFAEVQAKELTHPPRMLLLYGSNRERSYSRLAVMEAGHILERFGCEVKIFHPKGLPLPEDGDLEHPKVKELHELLAWSEGMVWCSPERHGQSELQVFAGDDGLGCFGAQTLDFGVVVVGFVGWAVGRFCRNCRCGGFFDLRFQRLDAVRAFVDGERGEFGKCARVFPLHE